jgi:hypothetical protein
MGTVKGTDVCLNPLLTLKESSRAASSVC